MKFVDTPRVNPGALPATNGSSLFKLAAQANGMTSENIPKTIPPQKDKWGQL